MQVLVSDCVVGNYASYSVLNEYDAILCYRLYRSLVKNGGSSFDELYQYDQRMRVYCASNFSLFTDLCETLDQDWQIVLHAHFSRRKSIF